MSRGSVKRGSTTGSLPEDDKVAVKEKKQNEGVEKEAGSLRVSAPVTVALVDSDIFATSMACVVVVNVILIGFETEFAGTSVSALFGAINNGFLLAYIVELMMRMLTHGTKAFKDFFTVMDLILVCLAFLERVMSAGGLARALPTFRMLRFSRLIKASAFFKHSTELNGITMASVKMFRTLRWVLFFMFFFLWTMATFAHLVIGHSAEWNETLDPFKTFPPFVALDIQQYFGSVIKSFFTLLQVLTLSQWAPHIARPIVKVYPVTFVFFIFFLFVTTYGLLIAVVSNLVQDSMLASKENAKLLKEKDREDRSLLGQKARVILAEVDSDGSGELDVDEIAYALKVSKLGLILRELGVPVCDAQSLVCLLDYNGNGQVSFDELVQGCVAMDEEITKRDYAMMGFWVKNLLQRTEHLERRLAKLCDQVSFIRKRLAGSFGSLNHMITTSKESQVRQKAIHRLKTEGPPLPPLLEKLKIIKPTLPKVEPKMQLQAFASRFLGGPPKPKRAGSPGIDEIPRVLPLFNNTMQPAPAIRPPRREDIREHDKYEVGDVGRRNPENPNLRALKSLL